MVEEDFLCDGSDGSDGNNKNVGWRSSHAIIGETSLSCLNDIIWSHFYAIPDAVGQCLSVVTNYSEAN